MGRFRSDFIIAAAIVVASLIIGYGLLKVAEAILEIQKTISV